MTTYEYIRWKQNKTAESKIVKRKNVEREEQERKRRLAAEQEEQIRRLEEKTTKQIEVIAQNTEDFETLDTRKVAMPGKLQGKSQDLDLIKQHSSSDEEGGKQLQLPGLRRAMSGTRATDVPRYSN